MFLHKQRRRTWKYTPILGCPNIRIVFQIVWLECIERQWVGCVQQEFEIGWLDRGKLRIEMVGFWEKTFKKKGLSLPKVASKQKKSLFCTKLTRTMTYRTWTVVVVDVLEIAIYVIEQSRGDSDLSWHERRSPLMLWEVIVDVWTSCTRRPIGCLRTTIIVRVSSITIPKKSTFCFFYNVEYKESKYQIKMKIHIGLLPNKRLVLHL